MPEKEFRIPHFRQLHPRLKRATVKARAKYRRRIQQILKELDPGRDYPFDYIRYRIIGYCVDSDTGDCFPAEGFKDDLEFLFHDLQTAQKAERLHEENNDTRPLASLEKDLEPEPNYVFEPIFEDTAAEKAILRSATRACKEMSGEFLSRTEEVALFRCYNFCKFQVTSLTRSIADSVDRFEVVEQINFYKTIALKCRNRIIECNLGLVRRAAAIHRGKNMTYDELISEGNNSLLAAVENFDYLRGNRFSTYATWAVTKNYARSIPLENILRKTFQTDSADVLDFTEENARKYKTRRLPELWRQIQAAVAKLPEKERIAVIHYFGVQGAPLSLRQIAPKLGFRSKEIVRRYKDRGLKRLQEILDAELYEEIYA